MEEELIVMKIPVSKLDKLCEELKEIQKHIRNNEFQKADEAISDWYNKLHLLCFPPDEPENEIDCPHCGERHLDTDNFCGYTGRKIAETCPHCWVLNKPYNCGHEKCPGYDLFKELSQSDKSQI